MCCCFARRGQHIEPVQKIQPHEIKQMKELHNQNQNQNQHQNQNSRSSSVPSNIDYRDRDRDRNGSRSSSHHSRGSGKGQGQVGQVGQVGHVHAQGGNRERDGRDNHATQGYTQRAVQQGYRAPAPAQTQLGQGFAYGDVNGNVNGNGYRR